MALAPTFGWNDIYAIGDALAAAHPDADRLNLDDAALAALVRALPGFAGPAQPDDAELLGLIRQAWIATDPDDDDGRHDFDV